MSYLISAETLAARLDDPKLRIVDATLRFTRGTHASKARADNYAAYAQCHITGAVFVDVERDIADPQSGLRFMLPSAAQFAETMARLGIGDDTQVVVYSATDMLWATRFWWVLRAFGVQNVAVLDGGLPHWIRQGLPITDIVPNITPAHFTARAADVQQIATKESISALLPHLGTAAVLVDTLSADHYRGTPKISYGYPRPGHIAGAINVPSSQFVDAETGCMLPPADIAARYDAALGAEDKPAIFYCGAGIAASLGAFAAAVAGRTQIQLYDASLQEWAADPALPMATGDAPA